MQYDSLYQYPTIPELTKLYQHNVTLNVASFRNIGLSLLWALPVQYGFLLWALPVQCGALLSAVSV